MRKHFVILIVLVLMPAILLSGCGKSSAYKEAMTLYENGKYHEASVKFIELGDFENSQEMVKTCKYEEARALFDAGSYEDARAIFAELGDYERSAENVRECDYQIALGIYNAGNLEAALDAFQKVSGYNDADTKITEIQNKLMHQKYSDVYDALDGNVWYFNGGGDTLLNRISFYGDSAQIAQAQNGNIKDAGTNLSYSIDDQFITVALEGGFELKISYVLSDGKISLGDKEYFTLEEIDAGLQGYWTVRTSVTFLGFVGANEYNIYINNGNLCSESAATKFGGRNGEYYYYGPDQGTYTLNFGGFETDLKNGFMWGFNIIDGKVTLLHVDDVCTPTDKLPGKNGYKF